MRDQMQARAAAVEVEDDMAVDAVLWMLLAAMIGFIYMGCVFTAPQ